MILKPVENGNWHLPDETEDAEIQEKKLQISRKHTVLSTQLLAFVAVFCACKVAFTRSSYHDIVWCQNIFTCISILGMVVSLYWVLHNARNMDLSGSVKTGNYEIMALEVVSAKFPLICKIQLPNEKKMQYGYTLLPCFPVAGEKFTAAFVADNKRIVLFPRS